MIRRLVSFSLLLSALGVASLRAESEVGVIVLANSGPKPWTKAVHHAVRQANMPYTTRVFMGAGDSPQQQRDLQMMVRDLEDEGANTIVVVPLAISVYSETFRQWKYLLGVDVQPGFNSTPLFPVERHSTVRFGDPLNDSAAVVEILLDRAQEISRKSSEETVFIVAAGARDDGDNQRWMKTLQSLSKRIQERGNYKSVQPITLRDDIPSSDRVQSMEQFRKKIDVAQTTGRALVIPLALTTTALEHKLSLELRGLSYVFNNKPLMPDTRISEWMRSQLP